MFHRNYRLGALCLVLSLGMLSACSVDSPSLPSQQANDLAVQAPASSTPSSSAAPTATSAAAPREASKAPFESLPGEHLSTTDLTSPWVVVNKRNPLKPLDFAPADLVHPEVQTSASGEMALVNQKTAVAAEQMFGAAAQEGVGLVLASGYRSYQSQVNLYGGYVAERGQAEADKVSARPGFSEHQSGWTFDMADSSGSCSFLPCFASTPAARWAAANAYKYGFIVRYQEGTHPITGYEAEPWHLRFVGIDVATDMHKRGITTLEEYLGLPAAPDYKR